MKRVPAASQVPMWSLVLLSVTVAVLSVALAFSAPEYDVFHVPFASWYIFLLNGLILFLAGWVFYWRRRFHRALEQLERVLSCHGLQREPGLSHIPIVQCQEQLPDEGLIAVIQTLFKDRRDVSYLFVESLPGGYGENTTVLVRSKSQRDDEFMPCPWVVKLGKDRDVEVERIKYENYVHPYLTQKPSLFDYAKWNDFGGIAYDLAQIDPESTLQSFQQFYLERPADRVSRLIPEIYAPLQEAWYQRGKIERSNLYEEYSLLSRKKDKILEHLATLIDGNDPYRDNLFAIEEDRRTDLKPVFCSEMRVPWYDPATLLKQWPRLKWETDVHRSIVHGDLNARNIIVEMAKDRPKLVWFIDFSHTGNGLSTEAPGPSKPDSTRGHTLRDFSRLEADIKFLLTHLQGENDLTQAAAFEKALLERGLALGSPADQAVTDESFLKAWQAIRQIRRLAAAYLRDKQDPRPYYFSLLHATLPIVYYDRRQFEHADEGRQKRYALMSAGMLSSQLQTG